MSKGNANKHIKTKIINLGVYDPVFMNLTFDLSFTREQPICCLKKNNLFILFYYKLNFNQNTGS